MVAAPPGNPRKNQTGRNLDFCVLVSRAGTVCRFQFVVVFVVVTRYVGSHMQIGVGTQEQRRSGEAGVVRSQTHAW